VPEGVIAAFCPEDWLLSVTAGVADAVLPDDWVESVELVHPAIMMPAIRIAEATSRSVMLFFMRLFTVLVFIFPGLGRTFSPSLPGGVIISAVWHR
jgi:hypothetical protein